MSDIERKIYAVAIAQADALSFRFPGVKFTPYVVTDECGILFPQVAIRAEEAEMIIND